MTTERASTPLPISARDDDPALVAGEQPVTEEPRPHGFAERFVRDSGWRAYRVLRRFVVLAVGLTVLVVGVVLIVTPGPAFIVIPVGLAILSIEFVWARKLLRRLRSYIEQARDRVRQTVRR
ncbi:MAG: PGPGW domain-containing protein [Planctomycetales bacterium]